MQRAFTLIELLVVIAIIAILSAILFPVFLAARSAAYQMVVVSNARQLSEASLMYAAEADETFMPAMGSSETGDWYWFGRMRANKTTDESQSLLGPYVGKKKLSDPTAKAESYMGDHSGFGYNWGFIGSDMGVTGYTQEYPNCFRPARTSELSNTSNTVTFATSNYYSARWEGGDGKDYDFGFIDPLGWKQNNPNVSFRHMTPRRVESNRVVNPGNAIVAMADGRARTVSAKSLKDEWFFRTVPDPTITP